MKPKLIALAVMMLLAPLSARASFTIDESAPRQSALTNIAPQTQETSLDVAFVPRQSWLQTSGKTALKAALAEFKIADEIRITCYQMPNAKPQLPALRAKAIKQWLTTNGVPASKITFAEAKANLSDSPDSATISILQSMPATTYADIQPARIERTAPPTTHIANLPSKDEPPQSDRLRWNLVQKLLTMAQNKLVKAEDAISMAVEILKQPEGSIAPPSPAPATSGAIAADLPRTWTLDNRKTLRENLEDWAKIANWQTPDWRANTAFDFPSTSLQGSFLEVLAELAKAVPALEFVANRATRGITVVDAVRP